MSHLINTSRQRYNIPHWSHGYFDINKAGELVAYPTRDQKSGSVNLVHLYQQLKQHGLNTPVLVRFNDILHNRIDELQQAFAEAIAFYNYQNQYTAVYPIKVNQQRHVAEQIAQHSDVGLEAGSKAELLAVLALAKQPNKLIICNGYKDPAYVRLALLGQQLGHEVYLIIEKPAELKMIMREAKAMQIKPLLGVRVRLASIAKGKWQNTGGSKSKFGLTALQLLNLIEALRTTQQLTQLQCLHFHLGSQIANIRDIQRGMHEGAQFFAECIKLGAPIHTVDIGGGLGVDYEGSRTRHFCSMNYSTQEYAKQVVHALHEIVTETNISMPRIVSESGRALTAHHAMLLTEVLDQDSPQPTLPQAPDISHHRVIHDLWQLYQNIHQIAPLEAYHEACHFLVEAQSLYCHRILSLTERANAEQTYAALCFELRQKLSPQRRAERDILDSLEDFFADKYFCNFSIFQSLPDIWAIQQIFPILPLNHLNQVLTERAILQDLTCDSDGRIDVYVDGQGLGTTLALPKIPKGDKQLLGVFLVGAYQEILGDIHNLFGETHAIHVELQPNGDYKCLHATEGDSIASVLRAVNFDTEHLRDALQTQLSQSQLSAAQREAYLTEINKALTDYTYLG